MLYIFDKDDNLLEIIEDYSNDELTRDIKGTFTFSFKYKVNATENIKKRNKVGFFIDDEKKDNFRLFIIDEVEEIYFNDEELYVYCINDYYSLKDNVIIDKRCNNYNVEQTLGKVLENTSYVLGDTINLGTKSLSFYYVSSLEAFNNTRETYGFEFDTRIEFNEGYTKIQNKYIDIKYHLGQDTGLRFTYDTNLTKVKRTISSQNHYNVLYGRGASLETDEGGYTRLLDFADVSDTDKNKPLGQKYVEDVDSIAKYGRIEGIYENKDIKDSTELLNVTWDKLQETKEPQVTYEVDAEDIRDIEGFEHYNANLGDSIIILDEDYNLNYKSRIIKDVISIKDKIHKITLGHILPSIADVGGSVVNPNDNKEDVEVDDTNFPNTLPSIPILALDNEGFATLSLSWTFENKSYYTYILYASQLENFNPTENNIIWQGQGSSFLHEVNFNETWYYRIRAKNTHNQYTDFSNQVTGTTYKISDATQVFEEAAIKDALIGDLKADRGWVGKFKGDYIDARNLTVTDGNGKRTLDIDSFGNVNLDVTSFSLKSTPIEDVINNRANTVFDNKTQLDIFNKLTNNGEIQGIYLQNKKLYLNGEYFKAHSISASSINVGDYTNFVTLDKNSTFAGTSGVTEGYEICSISGSEKYNNANISNKLYGINGGDKFRVKAMIKSDTVGSRLDITCCWRNANNEIVSSSTIYGAVSSANTWTEINEIITVPSRPSGASYVRFKINIQAEQYRRIYVERLNITRMYSGELIVDGSISAIKLSADAIDGRTIKGAIIVGGELRGSSNFFTAPDPNATDGYGFRIYSTGAMYTNNDIQIEGNGNHVKLGKDGTVDCSTKLVSPNISTGDSALWLCVKGAGRDFSKYNLIFREESDSYMYFRPGNNATISLGHPAAMFNTAFIKNGVSSSSDRALKENIKYLDTSLNENAEQSKITEEDLYNFVKDDLVTATYNFIGEDKQHLGFIAQDLLYDIDGKDNIIGQFIVNKPDDERSPLSYNEKIYTNVLAGALRYNINNFEAYKRYNNERFLTLEKRLEKLEMGGI